MPAAIAQVLQRHWWRPRLTPLTTLLAPLACVVGAVAARRRASAHAQALPVPVIVVGNVIVGGAGKTPTVIALVALLRRWGYAPGIVSRGHGRADAGALLLDATTPRDAATPAAFGDEPLLMHRRTGAPVAVAADGRYTVDHQAVDGRNVDALTLALRSAAESRKEPFLIISADAMSTHQAVINVMDAARRAGLTRMTFAAQTSTGAAEQP